MPPLILLLCSAFEFTVADPAAAGLAASAASGSWRSAFTSNAALLFSEPGRAAAAAFVRPYGLSGLYAGRIEAMVRPGELPMALGCCLAVTSFDKYQEHDLVAAAAYEVRPGLAAGLSVHGMGQVWAGEVIDLLAAVDAGAAVQLGAFRLGITGRRLNVPRLHDGSELPLLLQIGGSWQPVNDLLLALDVRREGAEESAALGIELSLVPQLKLRAGLATMPLRYSGGIGVDVGALGLGYAWQFHPQLKETHLVGAEVRWR